MNTVFKMATSFPGSLKAKQDANFASFKTHTLLAIFPEESWGPFLERSGKFSGPKSNIQIEIKRIRAWVLARKLLHFVSSTDSFIMLDAKLL